MHMTGCRTALFVLFAAACAHSTPTAAPPRAAVVPLVDHHQHLLSPAGAAVVNRVLPRIALPDEFAQLLAARIAHSNDAALLRPLYTEDALVLGPESPGWIRGRDGGIAMLSTVFSRPYDLVPVTYRIDGAGGSIAGYFTRKNDSSPIGYFFLDLQKGLDGSWRIAAETPIIPGPHQEPVVTAEDLIAMLDAAAIQRAVVLSDAYYFDAPNTADTGDRAAAVRAENDWTAEQVMRFPGRLVAFCSVNPLASYAVNEVDRCAKTGRFKGLKLHFSASGVDLLNREHVEKLRRVVEAANRNRLPLIMHVRAGGAYGREHALVLLDVLTSAPDVSIQIAHLWGGESFSEPALTAFAEAVEAKHPATRHLFFDVAQMWNASEESLTRAVALMRRIGMHRMLYGSDGPQFGGAPPAEAWKRFRTRVPLTDEEFGTIATNVAPYM
jgi:predicted TIM-barrel fold metal-dependent hydrolase